MIVVHHLENSRSIRIVWLLEELSLEHRIMRHERDATTMRAPTELKDIHPLGKSPVIVDGTVTLAESGAIIEYVTRKYGGDKLSRGPGSRDFANYLFWLHYTEGSLFTPLAIKLVDAMTNGGCGESVRAIFDAEFKIHAGFVEETLSKSDYLLESGFSAPDINVGFALEFLSTLGLEGPYPHITSYIQRLRSRPAYSRPAYSRAQAAVRK